ncbi:hypothetical protein GCM10027039_05840 [Terrabacter koreensis]
MAPALPDLTADDPHFEERAENLSAEQFAAWTNVTSFEEKVLSQLTSMSPRLLVGPRGCGKSTLMLLAAERLQQRNRAIPVYVNYGKSMFIEPAFTMRPDANEFFQEWLVARILAASSKAAGFSGIPELSELGMDCEVFVERAERDPRLELLGLPGPAALARLLEEWAREKGRAGVVLLLDDAAQAFVPEQQRIFFDFLQSLRTPGVTYKAAIYPGVTEYSPTYNLGHDAKKVDAWVPSGPDYLAFMHGLLNKRLGSALPSGLTDDCLDLFAVASFGIPRGFLAMVERFMYDNPEPGRTTSAAVTIVNEHAGQVEHSFNQLARKVPAYSNYIEAGLEVEKNVCSELRDLNHSRIGTSVSEQAVEVAVRKPISPKLNQVLALLEYSGIVRRTGETVSYGESVYERVAIHSAVLMARRALWHGKNPSLRARATAGLRQTRQHSSKRVTDAKLLPPEVAERCVLKMGKCENCGQLRPTIEARFCFNCGAELKDQSRYAQLVKASVDELLMTKNKLVEIKKVGFSTVEDVLNDHGGERLRKAKGVGAVWSRRITSLAVEYVNV